MSHSFGQLASDSGYHFPVQVLRSGAGFYIGAFDPKSGPVSRESMEYYSTSEAANTALNSNTWTQRSHP